MELFNLFFLSYSITKGPRIFYFNNTQVGKITLLPSKKNIFIKEESSAFLFDNNEVKLCLPLTNFITYVGYPQSEFENLCLNIWKEEFGSLPKDTP